MFNRVRGWGQALLIMLGVVIGVPLLMLGSSILFFILRWFHVINCSWWWIALPLSIMTGFLIFDEEYGVFG